MLYLAVERGEPRRCAIRAEPYAGGFQRAVEKGKWEILEPIAEKTVIATGRWFPWRSPLHESSARAGQRKNVPPLDMKRWRRSKRRRSCS